MTRSQIRHFVETSSVERIREVLDLLQKLKRHVPLSELPQHEVAFPSICATTKNFSRRSPTRSCSSRENSGQRSRRGDRKLRVRCLCNSRSSFAPAI
jgi:hypothetical protein